MRIDLTPEEWTAFSREISDDPKRSALQRCCGNISALRDEILAIKAAAGEVTPDRLARLAERWKWCRSSHDFDDEAYPVWKTLRKLIEQAGMTWPVRGSGGKG